MPLPIMSLSVDEALDRTPALPAALAATDSLPHLSLIAQHYLVEFRTRHPDILAAVEADATRYRMLLAVFSQSRFLSEDLLRHPEWIVDTTDLNEVASRERFTSRLTDFLGSRNITTARPLDFALFRRREILRIFLRDVFLLGSLPEVTEEISNLADTIVETALKQVVDELSKRYGHPSTDESQFSGAKQSPCQGFCVISLGKLGGRELNYSSDIDLMFLYAGNGETTGTYPISNREFFKKASNRLTDILSTYTAEGLCYRVDLRLRPEGRLGEVCISLDGALDYYARRARDWELQMLIKARVTAGDRAIGQRLLDSIEGGIYSTTLDFSLVETMSETRARIREKLKSTNGDSSGLNVKLARGGIRDIEFLVQCLQRLHGGREPVLRHGGTLFALSRLHEKDLLSATEHSRLSDAYHFLRKLEHRLQMRDDRQTHTLPAEKTDLDDLATSMAANSASLGVEPSVQLLARLNEHLENVHAIYERIVHAQRPLSYTIAAVTQTGDAPARDFAAKQESVAGETTLQISDALTQRAPAFADYLRQRNAQGTQAIFSQFLDEVVNLPSVLDLLDKNRTIAEYTVQIFKVSRYFAEQMVRTPELVYELVRVAEHPQRTWSFEGMSAPLSDIGALRRFFRREMFFIQAASICLPEPVFSTLDRTSALVEFMINRAYRIALDQALEKPGLAADAPLGVVRDEMMVVALGRLGMREFDLASDADILFIIPDSEGERQDFWARVAAHMIDILTTYTAEGTIVSIDTRLRPDGREGLLVQTESKYVDYFTHRAEAWEGIAYMKARAVAGDVERATNFLTTLQQVDWRRYGQNGRSRVDLRQMRLRLEREQGKANPLKAGRGAFYDADFALMYLRLKGAGLFFKSLNTPERIDIVEKMGHLDRNDAEFLLHATTFYRALDHGIRVSTGKSEGDLPKSDAALHLISDLVSRWTNRPLSADSMAADLSALQNRVRTVFDRLFA